MAETARRRLLERGAPLGPNVVVVVVRGLTLAQSRLQLPRTVRAMARLRRRGLFRSAVFTRFAPASEHGEAALQALMHGTPQRPLPSWASTRQIEQRAVPTSRSSDRCSSRSSCVSS